MSDVSSVFRLHCYGVTWPQWVNHLQRNLPIAQFDAVSMDLAVQFVVFLETNDPNSHLQKFYKILHII